jgi:hypothetical protein
MALLHVQNRQNDIVFINEYSVSFYLPNKVNTTGIYTSALQVAVVGPATFLPCLRATLQSKRPDKRLPLFRAKILVDADLEFTLAWDVVIDH